MARARKIHKSLSEILLESGKIDKDKLDKVLSTQSSSTEELGRRLVDLGLISEMVLLETLSEYLGIPFVSLKDFPPQAIMLENLSEKFMRQYKFAPLILDDNVLTIALNDPYDVFAPDAVKMATGYEVIINLAREEEILDAVGRLFNTDTTSMGRIIEDIGKDDVEDLAIDDEGDVDHLKDLASEAPVIRLVNLLITRAIELRASDIHLEPFEGDFKVRYRVDGVLHVEEAPPKRLQAAVISRIKIMAKLNIAERRLPQDGRIKLRVLGKEIDFRVSTLPTMFGESVVLRILDRETVVLDLEKLGFPDYDLTKFRDLINRPYGIILVTGPTGSGKTTTLYAGLSEINSPEKKIITVEDPIEYQLGGVNQVQVKSGIGLSFANILRSILRQDPDIIMIGEIRDAETAEIAIHSALTGHLVFSTLHTNDAAGAVTRLLEMGMENYLISSSLIGIMAQRLVRVICPECKEPYTPEVGVMEELGISHDEVKKLDIFKGRGCKNCANTGFRGRKGIYELLMMNDDIRELILDKTPSNVIKEKGRSQGMKTLREAGWQKVKAGISTVSEVVRVTQVE
ncbi:MAG: type II secretion system ATPase GspE [Deltaproteobacteria bacterium]|nr:type II secretion system ATPase GspE [Deltaproteobacteria bacterium]MBW2182406.1 type II secretion system ATPase GspE [Deltaproteobacteria bacterium]